MAADQAPGGIHGVCVFLVSVRFENLPNQRTCGGDFALMGITNSLAFRSQRLAQRNSVASMERPTGMTINAGPGKTISATPISVMVPPMMAMLIRLAKRR